ncbi:E3 ubiquitin-protein ligase TRIM7-like [Paroedura picta]|uniref:E3 ubiquitin-protein ligase TRIM7-like n=1 Tax=Paroedura picta TaxID=143630 RepID=UPI00405795AA
MATSSSPVSPSSLASMKQEACCPICLEFLKEPVTLDCGHNFCRGCIADYCDIWEGLGDLECPVCKAEIQKGNFRSNWQLAALVEKIKQNLLPASQPREQDLCSRHEHELSFFCKEDEKLLCQMCKESPEHRGHSLLNLEEAAHLYKDQIACDLEALRNERKEILASKADTELECQNMLAVQSIRKDRHCQKHQEPLKLFCKNDEALLCVVCDRSKEHRGHETLPLEEASQEYKDQLRNGLEILKKETRKILEYKGEFEKESQEVLEQTTAAKQDTAAKFRQLHLFLEEQEKHLVAQVEEVEKAIAKERDQHLAELSESLSALESLIREVEEKCQQSPSEILQDVRNTLQRYEQYERFTYPVTSCLALKWRIWDFCDINHLLEGALKQLKDTLDSELPLQKANVTLDPDTAHPILILSEDLKSVTAGKKAQALPNNPERFDCRGVILGREGFSGGRHFWEVLLGNEEEWSLGVARKSVERKGPFHTSPKKGVWAVGKWGDRYWAYEDLYRGLTSRGELKRIRVCLNYAADRVAFFDADRGDLLYEFSGAASSGETLLPFFWVMFHIPLTIAF